MSLKESKKKYTNEVSVTGIINKDNNLVDIDKEFAQITITLETKRTIKDFEDQAGIDFKTETIKGHNLRRILKINRTKQLEDNDLKDK